MGGTSGFAQPVNLQNQVTTFLYDAAGRLLSDQQLTYAYDDNNMLMSSSDGENYSYDAIDQRSIVTAGGSAREFYYFDGLLVAEQNIGSNVWTDFLYAGGTRFAEIVSTQPATPIFMLSDHIGSEIADVDANGNVISALDYTPFGQLLNGTSASGFMYTGLMQDSSELDHAAMRQYSWITGRWTVPDPYSGSYNLFDPQSMNRYSYVENKPLYYLDSTGEGPTADDPTNYGGGCGEGCEALIGIGTLGLSELISLFDSSSFTGNVQAQNQGKVPRSFFSSANFACAAKNAKSLASFLPGNAGNSFLAQTFLGNDLSTATNIVLGPHNVAMLNATEFLTSNPLPINATAILTYGIANVRLDLGAIHLISTPAQDAWGNTIFQTVGDLTPLGATVGFKVASKVLVWFSAAKLAFDTVSYGVAFAKCAAS